MQVVSTTALAHRASADFCLIFNTLCGDKSYLVGVTQGRLEGSNVQLGLEGSECLRHLAERSQMGDPDAAVHFAEIGSEQRAAERMQDIFQAVEDGAAIMFLCRSAALCDTTFALLNVQLPPGSVTRH